MVSWSQNDGDVATYPRPSSKDTDPLLQGLGYPMDESRMSLKEVYPMPDDVYLAFPEGYPYPADYFLPEEWTPNYMWPPDAQDRAIYEHGMQTLFSLNATFGFNVSLKTPFARLPNISMVAPSGAKVLGPVYHQKLREVILGAMLILAVIGNLMAVLKILRKWDHRGRMTVLSLNLTVADLLVTHLTILGQLMWEVLDKQWYLSNGACKIYKVAQTFSITASNYLVVVIALDRHEAVLRPLSRFVSAQNLALSAWAVSLLPSLPNVFIFFRFEAPGGAVYCLSKFYTNDLDKDFRQVYLVMVLFLVFVVPLVLLLVLYVRICLTLWKQSKYFRSSKRDCHEGRRTNSLLPRARTKALGMTVAIVVVFLVTNLPYVLQELIVSFGDSQNLNPNIVALFGIASASNSCFNPYIFLFFASKDKNLAFESYKVTFSKKIPPLTHAHTLPTSSGSATTCTQY